MRRALPSSSPGGCRVHLCVALPLHAATSKIDRRALEAKLTGIREVQQQHSDAQDRMEESVRCFYAAWLRLGVGLVCGPQVVYSAAASLSALASEEGADAAAGALLAVRLGGACLLRLLLLPELWAACVYLEERHRLPDCLLSRLPSADRLPSGPQSKWLPLVPAALLPLPWLSTAGLAACSYLGWAREHDRWIALGFAGVAAAAAAASTPWPVPADAVPPRAPAIREGGRAPDNIHILLLGS